MKILRKIEAGARISMFYSNRHPNPFVSTVAWTWDDNFDPLELKKSILKDAPCEIAPAGNGTRMEQWKKGTWFYVLIAKKTEPSTYKSLQVRGE